jgi:DNA mismatch endonuclease (patch repair protein)
MSDSSHPQLLAARASGKRPRATSESSRRSMVATSGGESAVERELRRRLFARGMRFRKHVRVLPDSRCRPDIVFTRARVAIFVDGCFWHRCPDHSTEPRLNGAWWKAKLDANVARDRTYDAALQETGWTVIRFWEHEDVGSMADAVERAVRAAAAR